MAIFIVVVVSVTVNKLIFLLFLPFFVIVGHSCSVKIFRAFLEHAVDAVICQVSQRLGIQRLALIITLPCQQLAPPRKEELVHNELEPGCELERRVVKQRLELVWRDVFRGLHLVLAGRQVDVGLDEEDVVD